MFRKTRLVNFTVVSLIMVLALLSNSHTGFAILCAAPGNPPAETVTIESSPEEQQRLLNTWTLEARANAKPMPLPMASVEDVKPVAGEAAPVGEPGFAKGGMPDPKADATAQREFPAEWQAMLKELGLDASAAPQGTAGVYTSYLGNYYSAFHQQYPYYTVGKLYITGGGYCSASVISPNNIIVTAAHCVYDTDSNQWQRGWTFVPADRAGAAPYGTFPWRSARVLTAWMNAPDSLTGRQYDVAVITLGPNSAGRPVTYYTGWLGRSWNYSYVQSLHAVGYPSNLNGGNYTYICAAESFYQSFEVLGMGCNMMHGSSGGPWIRVFTPYQSGNKNYVNSVVSGGLYGSTWGNTFYGPRFNSNNIVVLCTAQGC